MADSYSWTHEADVVVVGGGGAGMAAALSAAESASNPEVLLVQKIAELGGSTTMSTGSFTAADTSLQRAAGIEDDPEIHFRDIDKIIAEYEEAGYTTAGFAGDLLETDNRELRRVMVEEGGPTLEWLMEHGCEYAGPYRIDDGHSVPRSYQITPTTKAYADVLGPELAAGGVEVLYETEAYELVPDRENGAVRGLLAKRAGQTNPLIVKARRGVVLAAGDFVNNRELRETYTDDATSEPINHHNTGDGLLMARDLGAEWVNMEIQWTGLKLGDPLYTTPEVAELTDAGAILVNENGRRFVNELVDYDQLLRMTLRQPDERAYLVFDDGLGQAFNGWPNHISTFGQEGKAWGYLDDYRKTDVLYEAETVSELAATAGFPSDDLQSTVSEYNGGVYDERLDDSLDRFGREDGVELVESPFYALGPVHPHSVITDGGVAVDAEMNVRTEDDGAIPRLYAAGVMAGDVYLFGHGHHHNWVFTSGRRAGANAAAEEPWD